MEVRMISIYNSLTTIYKIKNGSEVSIGSVCHVVNDVASYVKILPRKPDHCGIFYVRTRSKIRSTSSNVNVSVHKINAFKIRNSLLWLKKNNKHYENVILNFDELDSWCIKPTNILEIEDNYDEKLNADENNIDNKIDSIEPCPERLIEDSDEVDVVKQIASDILSSDKSYNELDYIICNNCTIDAFPVKSFIRVYEDEFFWEKSFPHLFCYDVGGPDVHNKSFMKKRQKFISDKEYDKHVLKDISRRFCNLLDCCKI